jgi:hypothetical protein
VAYGVKRRPEERRANRREVQPSTGAREAVAEKRLPELGAARARVREVLILILKAEIAIEGQRRRRCAW